MKKTTAFRKRVHFFTLMELIVSMAVFSVLMMLLMQIFSSTQRVWDKNSNRTQTLETARTILDMMENDLKGLPFRKNGQTGIGTMTTSDSAKNFSGTGFDLCLLTSGMGNGNYDSLQQVSRYFVVPRLNNTTAKRFVSCLFYKVYNSDTDRTDFSAFCNSATVPSDKTTGADLIADNIYSLSVDIRSRAENGDNYPETAVITLKLMDESAVENYIELGSNLVASPTDAANPRQAAIERENVHTFTRLVVFNKYVE